MKRFRIWSAPRQGGGTVVAERGLVTVELANQQQFVTTGAGAYAAHYVGPILKGLGFHIDDMIAHAVGKNFSTNFKYKITAEKSYDGDSWTGFSAAVLTEQTTATYVVSSTHSTRSDYGIQIRFRIEVSDTGSKEVGVLSATVAIRLHT